MFKKFLFSFLLIFIVQLNVGANENINKLNQLFLNGTINQEVYIQSINNLGINTNNDIFINLFELFKQGIIDQNSYESSLSNLSDLAIRQPEEKVQKLSNEIQSYRIESCNGNIELCGDIREANAPFEFIYKNNQVILSDLSKNYWVDLGVDFKNLISEEYQDNGTNFYIIAQYTLSTGGIVSFKYSGTLYENSFLVKNLQLIAKGQIQASFNLKNI